MSEEAGLGVITLHGLSAVGFHGVLDFERADGQPFIVDVSITAPMPATDELSRTVDYSSLARKVIDLIEGEPVNLIETLANRIADVCLAEELVRSATVTVHKPAAPVGVEFSDVSVTITRRNHE